VEYELIRTKRKTIAIYIRDGRVIVRAPMRAPVREIDAFVFSKLDWIEKHLESEARRNELRSAFKLDYGSIVLFLGREYSVESTHGENTMYFPPGLSSVESTHGENTMNFPPGLSSVESTHGENTMYFPPGLSREQLRRKLIRYYKEQAQTYIADRASHFAKHMNVSPANIRIGSAKRSWGSCTSYGRLTFSWRLIMAPPEAVDYVVVHELAHLRQLNHSPGFWAIVARIIPDWKDRRKILSLLQKRLSVETWE